MLVKHSSARLDGVNLTDLPVQQPTSVVSVINVKTATALGLTYGQSLRPRADEAIE